MEREQIDEFDKLRDVTIEKLRRHLFVEARNHVFQLLELPAFEPSVAWDVFRQLNPGNEDELVLTGTVWRTDKDLEKLRSPIERVRHPHPSKPTIELFIVSVSSAELSQLHQELVRLRLQLCVGSSSGLEGSFYEIALNQSSAPSRSATCRFSWWNDLPIEWQDLSGWLDGAQAIFETSSKTECSVPLNIRTLSTRK